MQELNFEWFLFLSLLGITLLFWLIANRWINKRLISFLKKRDLLVIGREKNIIKLVEESKFKFIKLSNASGFTRARYFIFQSK